MQGYVLTFLENLTLVCAHLIKANNKKDNFSFFFYTSMVIMCFSPKIYPLTPKIIQIVVAK